MFLCSTNLAYSMASAGITIVTLGPEGTCHERAVRRYMEFQGVADFEIEYIADFLDGLEHLEEHEDELRLDLDIGEIDTTWLVYGNQKRFEGEVIGIPSRELFTRAAPVAA